MIKKSAFGCFAMGFRPAKVLQKSDYANRWRLYFSFLSVIFLNENEDNTKKTLFLTIIRSFFIIFAEDKLHSAIRKQAFIALACGIFALNYRK